MNIHLDGKKLYCMPSAHHACTFTIYRWAQYASIHWWIYRFFIDFSRSMAGKVELTRMAFWDSLQGCKCSHIASNNKRKWNWQYWSAQSMQLHILVNCAAWHSLFPAAKWWCESYSKKYDANTNGGMWVQLLGEIACKNAQWSTIEYAILCAIANYMIRIVYLF